RSPIHGRQTMHLGVDFGTKPRQVVRATADGTVKFVGPFGSYGKMIVLEHDSGITTKYAHNASLLVKKGQRVIKGQRIALSGTTGRSTGPHLHYEIWINGSAVDPLEYALSQLKDDQPFRFPRPMTVMNWTQQPLF